MIVKSNYQHLLEDRDHLLTLDEIYVNTLRRKEDEMDKLTLELKDTKDSLKSTQKALRESEELVDELFWELSMVQFSHLA